ncbi:MAG: DUF134 domain-containing protein [Candidatus Margulisiibacteriota bacterium]
MVRPKKWRYLSPFLKKYFFRPRGVALAELEVSDLKGDELEAMRLCYLEDLMHENAARNMRVSRRTLERILYSGSKKVTEALLEGKGINISFPEYVSISKRRR